jgi:cell wall-associated NlpC family hydrolase
VSLRPLSARRVFRPVLPVVAALLVLGATPARAGPLVDAQHRAAVLREQVADLEERTATAVEDYDGAQEALGVAVTQRSQADAALDAARSEDAGYAALRTARVRTLYELGGPLRLYGSVLRAGSPTDALHGVHLARRLLGVDARAADEAARAGQELARAVEVTRAAADAQVRENRRAEALSATVQRLLAEQQELLAGADTEVLRMAEEQKREQERRAQLAFAADLEAAQRAAAAATALVRPVGPALPTSQRAAAVVAAARAQLGKPYVWGATGPGSFDCSGLTGWAYAAAGVQLPRTSRSQWGAGPHPGLAELQPGDLLFWGNNPADPRTIHHVAIYLGAGVMIAAPHSGAVVRVQPVYANGYVGATRVG